MTVPVETRLVEHDADGVLVVFTYAFRIIQSSDLKVTLIDTNGAATVQTETTHYSVTGVGVATGGTVVFVTAPTDQWTVRIERELQYIQTTDLRDQGTFQPSSIENALDRLVMMIQQLVARFDDLDPVSTIYTMSPDTRPTAGPLWRGRCITTRDSGGPDLRWCCFQNTTDGSYGWQQTGSGTWL